MKTLTWTACLFALTLTSACARTPVEADETGTEGTGEEGADGDDSAATGAEGGESGSTDGSWGSGEDEGDATTGGSDATSGGDGDGDETTGDDTSGDATTGDATTGDETTGDETTGDETTGDETTGGEEEPDCCSAHDEAGCELQEVESCVCEFDQFCCQANWDQQCVQAAQQNCGLSCEGGGGGAGLPNGANCSEDAQCDSGLCYTVFTGGAGGGFQATCQAECIPGGQGGFQDGSFCDSDADCCGASGCNQQDGNCAG